MSRRPIALALVALGLLAGCVAPAARDEVGLARGDPAEGARPVVVAVVDSGIDPYHALFALPPGAPDAYELIGASLGAVPLEITREGSWEERAGADMPMWRNVTPGTLYAIRGTRILAVSFAELAGAPDGGAVFRTPDDFRILDGAGHGTVVAAMVQKAAPESVVVMVQADGYFCALVTQTDCLLAPSLAAGLEWIAGEAWIDVVSTSVGIPGNPPVTRGLAPELDRAVEATRAAHDAGKLVVAAAGNTPGPSAFGTFQGTPWTIAVGGAFQQRNASAPSANSLTIDVAADYGVIGPVAGTLDETSDTSGTSFAAPYVAGTLAEAVRILRERAGHERGIVEGALVDAGGVRLTRTELRDALNATARIPRAADWSPPEPSTDPFDLIPAEAPVLVGPAQLGWGIVVDGLAPELADVALGGTPSEDAGKDVAARYQAQQFAAREAYWDAW